MRAPFATAYAPHGMVCAVDHLAAAAGVDLLRRGGSAADAAVAANAVLAVTSQHLCGMGGDLFALVHDGTAAEPTALASSGRAGSGADADRLRAEGHADMPATGDIRATPVPGCVDGWLALHERYGRLPLGDVLAAARDYAADGFPASITLAAAAAGLPDPADFAGVRSPGDTVRRPGVARALDAIAQHGRAGFYEGEFGEGLLRLGNGEYEPADLARPIAEWVDPIGLDAFGRRVWTTPPPSQGYLTAAAAWMADGLDLPTDPDDPQWAHLLIEAARQAAFDRIDVLHEHADGNALLAPERLTPRRAAIDPDRAATLGDRYAGGGTTYLCAVDSDRMAVSLIQSNAAGFGSSLYEPNTGIFLQNRGIGFSLEPGHPAEYGPGRRPPHTLSPALVTHPDGRLAAVLGTMGGDSQPQILLQLLARIFHAGQAPADAVAAGRWRLVSGDGFDTWRRHGEVAVHVEGHAPPWRAALGDRGHRVESDPAFSHAFGHAHVVTVADDHVAGAADPRARGGGAAGWWVRHPGDVDEALPPIEGMSRAVLDSLAAHTALLDHTGHVVAVNRAWARFADEHPGDRWRSPVGIDYLAACEAAAKEGSVQAPLVADGVRSVLAGRQRAFHLDYAAALGDEELWFSLRATPLDIPGGGAVVSYTDITTRKRAETQLAHQALHDPLTGLSNRTLFVDRLSLALARLERRATTVAVLFLDLDRFKVVNDSLGHDVGDQLITAMAGRLRAVLRPGDTAARFGGDEFTVLCEEIVEAADAIAIADRILAAVAKPFQLEDAEIRLSTSVGIALASGPGDRPESLVRDADAAMYQAKQRGKARWVLFDDDMRASAVARLEVENALHRALERDEFRLHYQPIVEPAGGQVLGAEALVRWESPVLGTMPPEEWSPLAEEIGLVVPIGAWALHQACRQAAEWLAAGRVPEAFFVAVNVSGRQLGQPDLPDVVERALAAAALPARHLCVEITEHAVMADVDQAVARLGALREAGVRIALDDFGTGYSSLARLRAFPVDFLKIDKCFLVDDGEPGVLRAVVDLAHAMGLQAVAEGVGTEEQRRLLAECGCDAAQGLAFGPPVPPENF